MFLVKFEIAHEGCLVNEVSRAFPKLRFICPGGFVLGSSSVAELIIIDNPRSGDVEDVVGFFEKLPEIDRFQLLEQTTDKAFIYFRSGRSPKTFCSQVVEKNHGFRIGMEIQEDGLEKWTVGCLERCQAGQLLKDLDPLGQIKHASISETSWELLLDEGATQ